MPYIAIAAIAFLLITATPVRAQSHEATVLVLNIEKLNQLRQILDNMRRGYTIIMEGYNKVKAVTSCNFQLHDLFLESLYTVSPQIRQYHRVADIIDYQVRLVREYKNAQTGFRNINVFSPDQISYQARVYAGLLKASLQNLDELVMILGNRTLRMSDDERISAIDRIYTDMEKKLLFLRSFNTEWKQLAVLTLKQKTELVTLRELHGISGE